MDDELYQEFITESEESITQLNNSLLDLESNPEDAEAIDDIFRQAHTLKGNFGAMGFDNAATVAHAVEDLLDEVRNGRIEVTHERMDLVFDGMDEILDILHEIEKNGESNRDPSDLVDEIRAAAEPNADEGGAGGSDDGAEAGEGDGDAADADAEGDTSGGDAPALAADVLDLDDPAVADADRLYHAEIALNVGDMKAVDGGLFVEGLPEDLAVVGADPSLDRIEDGDFGETFVVFVADEPREDLEATLWDLWKVESVTLTDVSIVVDDGGEAESTGESEGAEAADHDGDATPDDAPTDASGGTGEASEPTVSTATPTDDVDADDAAAAVDAVVDAYTSGGSGDGEDSGADSTEGAEPSAADPAPDEPTAEPSSGGVSGGPDEPAQSQSDAESASAAPADADAAAGVESSEGSEKSADEGGSEDEGDAEGEEKEEEETRSISAVKSVRVDVDQLDELHSLVEQLVTSRIKLRQALGADDSAGRDTLDELDKISSNLQETVMDMRLIPLKKVFDKFPRLVRDLARDQDKRVNFSVEGQDIELDRTILDEISDPLMHVLRNAVDHGIEPPEEREAAGKPQTGSVELRARREHDTVVITVEDDGAGIDADVIRDKAAEKGIRPRGELAEMTDSEVYDYIFHPGFSTNDEITDVSGRGVGMDVVKTTVESLDGSVNVESDLGEGTRISIRLPVSVAIIKVLFVRIDDREFGVPIKYIDEVSQQARVQRVDGAEVIVHEERIFPLIRLREALEIDGRRREKGMTVRIRPADRQVALRCDSVSRQEEVVVTPLQGPLKGTEGLSGTAVVGDGNVVPILDVNSLSIPDEGKRARRQWTPPEDDAETEAGAGAEGAAD
ncbi:ATP-binding protein [Halobellus sp. EA9]|uniref:ATP-binding protein n=1 Tax=Halobellus sp. EA9 TaxID=3421647 RepID=UPI003EBF50F1